MIAFFSILIYMIMINLPIFAIDLSILSATRGPENDSIQSHEEIVIVTCKNQLNDLLLFIAYVCIICTYMYIRGT